VITVTGPTGGIGRHVLLALLEHDEPVRVVARNPDNLPAQVRERVEVVEGSTPTRPSSTVLWTAPERCSGSWPVT